jgi:hypothetical protein
MYVLLLPACVLLLLLLLLLRLECQQPDSQKGEVFTKAQPGKWSGKEGKHVPVATVETTFSGAQALVAVPHGMEKDHFTE